MDYKEAYDAMAVVMGTDQPRKAEAVAECWTCDDHRMCWQSPCYTGKSWHRPRLETAFSIEFHQKHGHDVRPVGDAEAQTRSVCGRCHGLAAVEDCVVCSAVAKHRAEAQGVKP